MFLHFPLILGNWCFCNIWAGIFCFIWTLFVPGSCSRLVLYGSMGTKAKPIFPLSSVLLHTSRAFIKNTCLKKADISRIPVPLIQRLSVCTEALSCADWESNLWIGANAFCFSFSLQTYIGSVVISMNPYRSLPIYTPEKVEEYRNRNFYELSPHMWVQL